MPSFYYGLCYVIESHIHFDDPNSLFWITFERKKNINLEAVSVWLTSQYDYLSVSHRLWGDYGAFKISFPFGDKEVSRVIFKQNELQSLNCEKSNPEYISTQQCLASYINSNNFFPCSTKCIPIRMEGSVNTVVEFHAVAGEISYTFMV